MKALRSSYSERDTNLLQRTTCSLDTQTKWCEVGGGVVGIDGFAPLKHGNGAVGKWQADDLNGKLEAKSDGDIVEQCPPP